MSAEWSVVASDAAERFAARLAEGEPSHPLFCRCLPCCVEEAADAR